jgi:FMN phosphatase YigB (HAD superfamily)
MAAAARTVFLFDVDNTLLDNDRVQDDLSAHLEREVGLANRDHYWEIFETLRSELGYADYLGALQRYRLEHLDDSHLPRVSFFLLDYPFADRLYEGALAALSRCRAFGPTVILSDGDVVFQPRKVQRAGLWDAVEGRVLIYLHKEQMLADVERRFPAAHYVMIDDKLRILAAMKRSWGERVTTIFVRQGHYALDPRELAAWPAADLTIAAIDDLRDWDPAERPWLESLRQGSAALQGVLGALLEAERQLAPPASPLERLQQITTSPEWAWLQPLYRLIADIDHALAHARDLPASESAAIGAHARELLSGGGAGAEQAFLEHYRALLQSAPAVAMAHAGALRALQALPPEPATQAERLHARHQWNERRRFLRMGQRGRGAS